MRCDAEPIPRVVPRRVFVFVGLFRRARAPPPARLHLYPRDAPRVLPAASRPEHAHDAGQEGVDDEVRGSPRRAAVGARPLPRALVHLEVVVEVDAETAKRAGVPFVAVTSGVTPKAAFDDHPKHAVLDSVNDLPGWLSAKKGGVA